MQILGMYVLCATCNKHLPITMQTLQILSNLWYRHCCTYIWVINKFIANWAAAYIRDLTICIVRHTQLISCCLPTTTQTLQIVTLNLYCPYPFPVSSKWWLQPFHKMAPQYKINGQPPIGTDSLIKGTSAQCDGDSLISDMILCHYLWPEQNGQHFVGNIFRCQRFWNHHVLHHIPIKTQKGLMSY